MKKFTLLTFFFITLVVWSQETVNSKKDSTVVNFSTINGKVLNASNNVVIENVHVVNLNSVKGTLTDENGNFMIKAAVNDTIYFSYLGFKSIRVRVTNDWMKFGEIKIKMTELSIALEEVVVKPVELTGYIEVDAKVLAREVFVGTLGTIFGIESADEDPASLADQIADSGLTAASGVALVVFFTIALQCVSTVALLAREAKSARFAVQLLLGYLVLAWLVAWLVYSVASPLLR